MILLSVWLEPAVSDIRLALPTVRQMCKVPVCTEDMDSFGGERDSIQQKSCQLEEQDRGGLVQAKCQSAGKGSRHS